MAQGLQIWDSNGKVLLDVGSSIVTILGQVVLKQDVATFNRTITDPKLSLGEPFYFFSGIAGSTLLEANHNSDGVSFTVNLTNYAWDDTWSGAEKGDAVVYYGVY